MVSQLCRFVMAATVAMDTSVYVLLPHADALDREALLTFVGSVAERSMEALGARLAGRQYAVLDMAF